MKLYETLVGQLKRENNFVSDNGEVKKWVVADKARNYDATLLSLLLENNDLRQVFFKEIQNTTVFLLEKFLLFIEQKNYLNDSYTAYRNKIGLTIGGRFLNQRDEVELVWPYKDCILEGGQTKEDQTRPEIFFNQILAHDEITQLLDPKVLTRYKRYGTFTDDAIFHRDADLNAKRGLPKDTITDNLIIKGNNLLALHSLKKEFVGKVKLIYIDPPYNTQSAANTFAYNNSFNHSSWLTFMKNRLEISKQLLKENGTIWIAIDHYELFYLGELADEVFGRENRMGVITVVNNPGGRQDEKFFPTANEFMLVYAKNIDNVTLNTLGIDDKKRKQYQYGDEIGFYKLRGFRRSGNNSLKTQRPGLFYPIYYNEELGLVSLEEKKGYDCILPIDESGTERCWRWGKDTFLEKYNDYIEIKRANGKLDIYVKERETDYIGEKPKTVWNKPEYTGQTGTNEIKKLLGEKCFSYPKSLYAVKDVVRVATNNNDIVLDFFAGSGTTAHSVLDLNDECGGNRQFIICEQMDYIDKVTVERIKKVIENKNQGNFIYFELKKFNQAFIERIEAAKDTETLLQIWEQMKEKSFLAYNVDIKAQESNMDEFMQLDLAQQKSLLCELLDKNQLYVNLSDMSDSRFETTEEEYSVTQAFYSKK